MLNKCLGISSIIFVAFVVSFLLVPQAHATVSLGCDGIPANANQCQHTSADVCPSDWYKPTVCPAPSCGQFADTANNTFYSSIVCLSCRGIVNGTGNNNYSPAQFVRRGEYAQMLATAAQYDKTLPSGTPQYFTDVPSSNVFYVAVEELKLQGVTNGFTCGGTGEPCDSANRPYFRINAEIKRGEAAQMLSKAKIYGDVLPAGTPQYFADVLQSNVFYVAIEQLKLNNVTSGYPCGGTGEPCDSQNRPYFRINTSLRRDETAAFLQRAYFVSCPVVTPPVQTCTMKSVGDANCDGIINDADYTVWEADFQGSHENINTRSDFNADGTIDLQDFEIWRTHQS